VDRVALRLTVDTDERDIAFEFVRHQIAGVVLTFRHGMVLLQASHFRRAQ
jgi:hypothetical protein